MIGICLVKETGRITITVLKRLDTKDLFKDHPVKTKYSGPYPIFKEGRCFMLMTACQADFVLMLGALMLKY